MQIQAFSLYCKSFFFSFSLLKKIKIWSGKYVFLNEAKWNEWYKCKQLLDSSFHYIPLRMTSFDIIFWRSDILIYLFLLCISRFSEKIKSSAWKSLNMLNQPSYILQLLSRLCFLRVVMRRNLHSLQGLSNDENWSLGNFQAFFLLVKRESSE